MKERTIALQRKSSVETSSPALARQEKTDNADHDDCGNHRNQYRELMLIHAASVTQMSYVSDSLLRSGLSKLLKPGCGFLRGEITIQLLVDLACVEFGN